MKRSMNTKHLATSENLTEVKLFKVYIFILMRKVLLSGFTVFPFLRLWGELRETFLTCNVVRFPETDSVVGTITAIGQDAIMPALKAWGLSASWILCDMMPGRRWVLYFKKERGLGECREGSQAPVAFYFNLNLLESKLIFENCLQLKSPWLLLPCSRSFLWDYNHTISSTLYTQQREWIPTFRFHEQLTACSWGIHATWIYFPSLFYRFTEDHYTAC